MPQMLREPAQRFMVLGVGFLLFIMACCATVLYWSLDLQYPFTGVTGTFKGWDEDRPNIGHVEWTGQRWRYCPGRISRWVINNGRFVHFSQNDFPGYGEVPEEDKGNPDTVYAQFEIPYEVKRHLIQPRYRIRIEYACNPLQRLFPIVVAPPEVSLLTVTESLPNESHGLSTNESSR